MAHSIVFFLAPDDETAAATRLRGPGEGFASVTCRSYEPDTTIVEWDMHFEDPAAGAPTAEQFRAWQSWPEYVTPPLNDGVEVFALPQRLTRTLAGARPAELEALANRWAVRLRAEGFDDLADDDLLATLRGVAGLAASALDSNGGLYSWSC
ncbi:hypothetical protein [Kitasatospora sp. NPDC057198]|uniref:hypothetical protein n=1 Tax=Kitasatospora sp. NPDC057198 TaxID=3346046 RepID=UPI003624C169